MNLSLFCLLIGTSSYAGERLDEKPWKKSAFLGYVESTVFADPVVKVPGYALLSNFVIDQQYPKEFDKGGIYIAAQDSINEDPWYFKVVPESTVISVSDEFVKKNKLKVRIANTRLIPIPSDFEIGGELKYVQIPTLQIGGMTLENITAFVSSSKGKFDPASAKMQIGLAALSDVSYALLSGEGSVLFQAAAGGGDLVRSIGTPIPYDSSNWAVAKYGTTKFIAPYRGIGVKASLNDQEVSVDLQWGYPWNLQARSVPVKNPTFALGNHYSYSQLSLGPIQTNIAMGISGQIDTGTTKSDSIVGLQTLYRYDLAVSPADSTISLRPVESVKWQNYTEKVRIPMLEKKIAESSKADENGDKKDPKVSDLISLSVAYSRIEQPDKALPHIIQATELKPEDCSIWSRKASFEKQLGKEEYTQSLEKGAKLFHRWWDIPLERRLEIKKEQAKAQNAEERKEAQQEDVLSDEIVWHFSQKDQCFRLDSGLAAQYLNDGNHAKVQQMYTDFLDLDENMALVYGNSALIQGKLDEAEAAYRQALRLESTPDPRSRTGLALYFADMGEWRFAEPLFEEVMNSYPGLAMTGSLWLDNARAQNVDTLKKAYELNQKYPDVLNTYFLLIRESKVHGNKPMLEQTFQALDAKFKEQEPFMKDLLSYGEGPVVAYVRSLVQLERVEEAQALFDFYLKDLNSNSLILLAAADIAAASGKIETAESLLRSAGKLNVYNPSYALLLR